MLQSEEHALAIGRRFIEWQSTVGGPDLKKCPYRSKRPFDPGLMHGVAPAVRELYRLFEMADEQDFKISADRYAAFMLGTVHDPISPDSKQLDVGGMSAISELAILRGRHLTHSFHATWAKWARALSAITAFQVTSGFWMTLWGWQGTFSPTSKREVGLASGRPNWEFGSWAHGLVAVPNISLIRSTIERGGDGRVLWSVSFFSRCAGLSPTRRSAWTSRRSAPPPSRGALRTASSMMVRTACSDDDKWLGMTAVPIMLYAQLRAQDAVPPEFETNSLHD